MKNEASNYKNKVQILNEILFHNNKKWNIHRLVIYSLLCIAVSYLGMMDFNLNSNKNTLSNKKDELLKYDTYIPKGYTLLPIELENSSSIDSMFGKTGIVDLYVRPQGKLSKLKLVAKRVKLIRAPKNPNVFAILCPRNLSLKIYSHSGPFFVSILNPKDTGIEIVNDKRQVRYEVDHF